MRRCIDDPGNAICLCANCCAKLSHGAIESDGIIDQILSLKLHQEGGVGKPGISVAYPPRT